MVVLMEERQEEVDEGVVLLALNHLIRYFVELVS
jgi:hypothetical protein